MTSRSIVLVVGFVVGCQGAAHHGSGAPTGGSGGISSAGTSTGGQSGALTSTAGSDASVAGAGAGAAGHGGAPAEAGAAGHGGAPAEAGAAGHGGAPAEAGAAGHGEGPGHGGGSGGSAIPTEGGAGGGGLAGGDGCTKACSSTQTCVAGVCKDHDCPPSASFCSGSSLRTCAQNGLTSVEVTTCGQGKYCDADSAGCKTGFSHCPNIYLGSGRFAGNPPPALQANDAIVLNSYDVKVNTVVFGQVRVNNLGTDDSPITHIELYLSAPPGFPANQNQRIFEDNAVIPGAAVGGDIGEYAINWSYTFSTSGHYVLLARIENSSPPTGATCTMQGYDLSSPATNPQTAIHYLNVVE